MICYRDETFCASPGCVNACGRKLTPEVWEAARKWWGGDDAPVAVGWFCGGDPTKTPATPAVTPGGRRTKAEVYRLRTERAMYGGCCERFADNSGCDCFTEAVGPCPVCSDSGYATHPRNGTVVGRRCFLGCSVRCSVCNDSECGNPGGQH